MLHVGLGIGLSATSPLLGMPVSRSNLANNFLYGKVERIHGTFRQVITMLLSTPARKHST